MLPFKTVTCICKVTNSKAPPVVDLLIVGSKKKMLNFEKLKLIFSYTTYKRWGGGRGGDIITTNIERFSFYFVPRTVHRKLHIRSTDEH